MKKFLTHAFLIIVSLFSIFPFIWIAISATNTSIDVISGKLTPGTQFFNNINVAFNQFDIWTNFTNSVIITFFTVLLTLLVTSIAAYYFSINNSLSSKKVFGIMIASMMVPFFGQLVYLFIIVSKAGFSNSYIGAILPIVANTYIMFFLKQSFDSYPHDIFESAKIDGLTDLQIFYKILLPSSKNIFSATTIILFLNVWNSYLWPLIVLQSPEKYTLPVLAASSASGYNPDYGAIMIILIVSTIPSLLVFFALQKSFVQGIGGALK
ncbi:carbohydrate ABC transporter permease [Mollicutes bacterium LVI A0039]|nr:carbohydrate ABC transporter permease [Mollicutes bacterium LVI A0039]